MIRQENVELFKRKYDYRTGISTIIKSEVGIENLFFYKQKEVDQLKLFLDNNETNSIPENSRVYFASGVIISRAKFREWARQNGSKVVLDPSKADIIIVDKEKVIPNTRMTPYKLLIKEKVIQVFDDDGKLVNKKTFCYYEDDKGIEYITGKLRHVQSGLLNGFDQLLNISHVLKDKKVLSAHKALGEMNSMVLDFEGYKNILSMLNSADEKDRNIGLELLSNYNYEDSQFYIALLPMKINFQSSQFNFSSVSLRPLKKFIDRLPTRYAYNVVDYFRNLNNLVSRLGIEEKEYVILEQLIKDAFTGYLPSLEIDIFKLVRPTEKVEEEKEDVQTIQTF